MAKTTVLGGPLLDSPKELLITHRHWHNYFSKTGIKVKDETSVRFDLDDPRSRSLCSNGHRVRMMMVNLFENNESLQQIIVVNYGPRATYNFKEIAPALKQLHETHGVKIVYMIDVSGPYREVTTFKEFISASWEQTVIHTNDYYLRKWTLSESPYYGLTSVDSCFNGDEPITSPDTLNSLKVIDLKRSDLDDQALEQLLSTKIEITTRMNDREISIVKFKSTNGFDNLILLDLKMTNITEESADNIARLLKNEKLRFINIYSTDFSTWLKNDFEHFEQLINGDPQLFSKLIWLWSADEDKTDQFISVYPEKYRRMIKENHRVFMLFDDWYMHLCEVDRLSNVLKSL